MLDTRLSGALNVWSVVVGLVELVVHMIHRRLGLVLLINQPGMVKGCLKVQRLARRYPLKVANESGAGNKAIHIGWLFGIGAIGSRQSKALAPLPVRSCHRPRIGSLD